MRTTTSRFAEQKQTGVCLLAVCALALVALLAICSLWGEYTNRKHPYRHLVISGRPLELDKNLQALASTGRLTYSRFDTEFGKKMVASACEVPSKLSGSALFVVANRLGSENVQCYTGEEAIGLIDTISTSRSNSILPFIWAAGLGALLGGILKVRVILWCSCCSAFLSSLWLTRVVCLDCDSSAKPVLVYVGMALYAVMALTWPLVAERKWPHLIALPAILVLIAQCWLLYSAPSGCLACATIFGANTALACSFLFGWSPEQGLVARQKVIMCGSPLLLGLPILLFASSAGSTSADVMPSGIFTTSLVGQPLHQQLGLKRDVPGSNLYILARQGCPPCDKALAYLDKEVKVPYKTIYLLRADEQRLKVRGDQVVMEKGFFAETPTFLVLDSRGTVIHQQSGWSDDSEWVSAFSATIKDLVRNASGGAQ